MPLLSEGNQLFTFVANSRGAHAAIADLSRRYLNHARRHSDVLPKIKLEVDSYQHKTKAYGRIKVPDFAPAGWAPKTFFAAALAAAGYASESETSVSDPVSDPAANLDDEIPF